MNIEININDNLWVTELEKMIQNEIKSEWELLLYIYDSNKVGKRIKKNSFVWRELVGMIIGAFSYEIDKSKPSSNLCILDICIMRQAKKMLFFIREDSVWLPFVMIIDNKSTWRDIKLQIFKFLYPIINFRRASEIKLHPSIRLMRRSKQHLWLHLKIATLEMKSYTNLSLSTTENREKDDRVAGNLTNDLEGLISLRRVTKRFSIIDTTISNSEFCGRWTQLQIYLDSKNQRNE